jgi:hypothetical protein
MPTITLTIDATLARQLDELSDFEGESLEETIQIALRGHYAHLERFRAELEASARRPCSGLS